LAISLWFEDSDPLSIHLLGEAAYRCLDDLSDQIGMLRSEVGHEQCVLVYDYLRHASPNRDGELFWVRGANRWILFEIVGSYEKFFRQISPTMRAFQLYFMLHCLKRPATREELLEFLPYVAGRPAPANSGSVLSRNLLRLTCHRLDGSNLTQHPSILYDIYCLMLLEIVTGNAPPGLAYRCPLS
jgi:hypothetical protein